MEVNSYLEVWKKYAVFSGRASRSEFWYFNLFNAIVIVALVIVDTTAGTSGVLTGIYVLALLLPSLGVTVRRLHDTNHSGAWILLSIVPLIGGIVLLVFEVQDSDAGTNTYGPNPRPAGGERVQVA